MHENSRPWTAAHLCRTVDNEHFLSCKEGRVIGALLRNGGAGARRPVCQALALPYMSPAALPGRDGASLGTEVPPRAGRAGSGWPVPARAQGSALLSHCLSGNREEVK